MAYQEGTGYCEVCDRQVMIRRKTVNHVLHLLLTIFFGAISFGVGALIWMCVWFISAKSPGEWRCTVCGRVAKPGEKKPPAPAPEKKQEKEAPADDDDDRPNVYVIE